MDTSLKLEKLPPRLSVYIDFLRIFAALLVMISHYPLTAAMQHPLEATNYAYDAVVVFFVLSGYVISYSAQVLERNANTYIANRLARILPVAISAVLFSSALFFAFHDRGPHIYGNQPAISFWLSTTLQSITFTNQIWNNNLIPFYNGPYWSLAIEVWCYILYASVIYFRGWSRIAALVLIAIIVGPKTIIMFPMWLAGSAAFHLRHKLQLPKSILILILILPVAAYWAIQLPLPRDWSYPYAGSEVEALIGFGLEGAANFGWGYILAALVALHLYAMGHLCKNLPVNFNNIIVRSVRKISGYTFTLYLFHIPTITLLLALSGTSVLDFSLQDRILMYAMIFLVIYLIGNIVEHKKATFRAWAHRAIGPISQSYKPSLKV